MPEKAHTTRKTKIDKETLGAIAEFLTAGLHKSHTAHQHPFCVFLGGHTAAGKTHFATERLLGAVTQHYHSRRDVNEFHAVLGKLIQDEKLFTEYSDDKFKDLATSDIAAAGKYAFDHIIKDFPPLASVRKSNVAFINPDMMAYCTRECRDEKREEGKDFVIQQHYYKALHSLPSLMHKVAKKSLCCVVDSTLGTTEVFKSAVGELKNYVIATLLFTCADKEKAYARTGKRVLEGGHGQPTALIDPSIDKFHRNFNTVEHIALKRGPRVAYRFMGVIDTSQDDYKLVMTQGKMPKVLTGIEPFKDIEPLPRSKELRRKIYDAQAFQVFQDLIRSQENSR